MRHSLLIAVTVVWLTACASSPPIASRASLRQQIANLDKAYGQLRPDHVKEYNTALSSIAIRLEQTSAAEARSDLADANVSLDLPKMKLPLVGFHRVREPNETAKVGVPMVIEYDTTQRSLYPPEGMLMPFPPRHNHTPSPSTKNSAPNA